jgi:phage major head subunit gpT-like protein
MLLNRTALGELFKTVHSGFQSGMDQKPPIDLGFATTPMPSTGYANIYPWLETVPGFKEWVGDRQFQDLKGQLYEVPNRKFELSLAIPEDNIRDDTYGVFAGMLPMLAAGWPIQLYELLVEVFTNRVKAWDGKVLFSTTHKYGKNTISNLVTDALSKTSFEAAFTAAAAWLFSNGKPCRTQFTHLLYGQKLEGTVFDLINNDYVVNPTLAADSSTYVGGAVKNRNYKKVIPVQVPDFVGDYDDYWCLLDCSKPIKPAVLQRRKEPQVRMTTDPEKIEEEGEVKIMASGRAAAAPTFFHLAYGGVL